MRSALTYKIKQLVKDYWIALIAFAIVFALLLGVLLHEWSIIQHFFQVNLVDFVRSFGPYAWVVFLILSVISTITPFPDSVLTFLSGFLFGPIVGTLLTLLGSTIGNSIDFWLARKYGREYVHRKFPHASETIDSFAKQSGWQSIIILRLIPNPLPFDWMSYAAGISPISYWKFLLAMIIGVLPLQIITVLLGFQLQQNAATYTIFALLGIGGIIGFAGLLYNTTSQKTKYNTPLSKNKKTATKY
jgi:uncharacterized membrane protein YdjX (TVP38/TMEM64 family)